MHNAITMEQWLQEKYSRKNCRKKDGSRGEQKSKINAERNYQVNSTEQFWKIK